MEHTQGRVAMPLPRVATPRARRHAAPHRRGRRALFPAHVGVEAHRPPARPPAGPALGHRTRGPGPLDTQSREIRVFSKTLCEAPAVCLAAGGASIFHANLLVSREESRMGCTGGVKMNAPPHVGPPRLRPPRRRARPPLARRVALTRGVRRCRHFSGLSSLNGPISSAGAPAAVCCCGGSCRMWRLLSFAAAMAPAAVPAPCIA